jgi:hypothetical protein
VPSLWYLKYYIRDRSLHSYAVTAFQPCAPLLARTFPNEPPDQAPIERVLMRNVAHERTILPVITTPTWVGSFQRIASFPAQAR